ncbi:uncharacterized protein LOC132278251 [Cornus florida]|uniref:uncharacterized protein LOC132278251 n=1 Tax=Cornus florida TaxID=4283 RepID=UPI0028975264|nr:uncharacterized protein LOC132278251 [Cornus florida]
MVMDGCGHSFDFSNSHAGNSSNGTDVNDDDRLLQCDSENIRRQKFEAILKIQQENSGLIEPKRNEVLLPGMFLPQPIAPPTTVSDKEATEQDQDLAVNSGTNLSGSMNRPSTSGQRNSGMRKHRVRNSRKPVKQWIKKDNGT